MIWSRNQYSSVIIMPMTKQESQNHQSPGLYTVNPIMSQKYGAIWPPFLCLDARLTSDIQAMEANASAPNGVGIGLDCKYPNGTNAKLIALQADDEVVWSPLELLTVSTTAAG